MASHTAIQWCDSSVNPVMGCDGCELWRPHAKSPIFICYAGQLHQTRGKTNKGFAPSFDQPTMFPGRSARAASCSDLAGKDRLDKPWLNGLPRLIFVSDMGDALSKDIPFAYLRTEIIDVANGEKGRRHVWLWLTKQPGRMADFGKWLAQQGSWWPANVWVGTSVTSRKTQNRVAALLGVGDATTTRFLSVEPQWEQIDFADSLPKLDWIIQGGQSGGNARPFDLAWARGLRAEARRAGTPYFLKQLGAHSVEHGRRVRLRDRHGGDWAEWPEDLRVRELPALPAKGTKNGPRPTVEGDGKDSPRRRHLPVLLDAGSMPAPPTSPLGAEDHPALSTDERSLFLRGEEIPDPEKRWEVWAKWFRRYGSVLFRWLALSSVRDTFWGRDPRVVRGYVPARARHKTAKLAVFYIALRNDMGLTERTARREIDYANALIDRFGKDYVLGLLGTRVANDDRFLRDLTRLKDEAQAKDAVHIYVEGGGEVAAERAMDTYLAVQQDREELENPPEEDEPEETIIPWVATVGGRDHLNIPRQIDVGVTSIEGDRVEGFLALPVERKADIFRRVLVSTVPLTFESSLEVGAQVVGELQRPYLKRATVTPVTTTPALQCPACGTTSFWPGSPGVHGLPPGSTYVVHCGVRWFCTACNGYDDLSPPHARPGPRVWLGLRTEWKSPRKGQSIRIDGEEVASICWENEHDRNPALPEAAVTVTMTARGDGCSILTGVPWFTHWTTEAMKIPLRKLLRSALET